MKSREEFLAETKARDTAMGVTPYFMHLTTENIPQSYVKKQYVAQTDEVVQIRFPADTRYSPVYPVTAMWTRIGNDVITYGERFAEAYRAFVNGDDQIASGTPLEMLNPYGMTPDLISYCRTMKIYSVEALHNLEGQNLKNLGMRGNRLKEMARDYMASLTQGVSAMSEIEELRAEIARLKGSNVVPEQEFDGVDAADIDDFAIMTDDELRAFLEDKTGLKPDGRWNRERLENMARGAA